MIEDRWIIEKLASSPFRENCRGRAETERAYMHVKRNFRLLGQARNLRKNMTPQETKLWYQFLRTYPVKVYKQRIIESFIADFYCASARLVIEIDGSQHFTA